MRHRTNHDVGFKLRAVRGTGREYDILPSEGWSILLDVWSTTKERLIIERVTLLMTKGGRETEKADHDRVLGPVGAMPLPAPDGWPEAPVRYAPVVLEWPESATYSVGGVRALHRAQFADIEYTGLEFLVSPRRKFTRRLPWGWRRFDAFPPPSDDPYDVIGPGALEGPAPIERVPRWRRWLRRWPRVGW